MTELVTVTKVRGADDWQGIYVGDQMGHQNHSVDIDDINIRPSVGIDTINTKTVPMNELGITQLPDSLNELENRMEFLKTVKDNKKEWSEKIRELLASGKSLNKDEIVKNLEITEGEFHVITGCFMSDGIRDNSTALGEEAILAYVDNGVQSETKYTLIESDNALTYE